MKEALAIDFSTFEMYTGKCFLLKRFEFIRNLKKRLPRTRICLVPVPMHCLITFSGIRDICSSSISRNTILRMIFIILFIVIGLKLDNEILKEENISIKLFDIKCGFDLMNELYFLNA